MENNLSDNTIIKAIADEMANIFKTEIRNSLKDITKPDKLTYTPKEAAKVLGIGINAIYGLLKNKDFPKFKLPGGDSWYISRKGLEEWINKQIEVMKYV